MNFRVIASFWLWFVAGWAGRADAIIFLETADPQHHTTTPGDNSGWQYEGKFLTFLGVPIAPHFFITAKHIGGSVGNIFDFHGDSYTTIGFQDCPSADLRIWEIAHTKPFPTYAPLSSGGADVGAAATVFGRGTRRGDEVVVGGEAKGWKWGPGDDVERWGRNTVVGTVSDPNLGEFLYCDFDNPGLAGECHLSTGDSGGGLFVLENGLWRLAGVNYAVDDPFRTGPSAAGFHAALYDAGGLEYADGAGWTSIPEQAQNQPSSFYCTRIAAALPWISGIAPEVTALADENYADWLRLYFTPAQIAAAETGPLADFDGDGIGNLLEFALNLDPTFNERATMTLNTGLRGLPLVRMEHISGEDRVTLEFVRRTSGSSGGLTYTAQFSSDLSIWQTAENESVVAINSRWERVKIVDAVTTDAAPRRFARVRVALTE